MDNKQLVLTSLFIAFTFTINSLLKGFFGYEYIIGFLIALFYFVLPKRILFFPTMIIFLSGYNHGYAFCYEYFRVITFFTNDYIFNLEIFTHCLMMIIFIYYFYLIPNLIYSKLKKEKRFTNVIKHFVH